MYIISGGSREGPGGPGPPFFYLARPSYSLNLLVIKISPPLLIAAILAQQEVPGMEAPPQSSARFSTNNKYTRTHHKHIIIIINTQMHYYTSHAHIHTCTHKLHKHNTHTHTHMYVH